MELHFTEEKERKYVLELVGLFGLGLKLTCKETSHFC